MSWIKNKIVSGWNWVKRKVKWVLGIFVIGSVLAAPALVPDAPEVKTDRRQIYGIGIVVDAFVEPEINRLNGLDDALSALIEQDVENKFLLKESAEVRKPEVRVFVLVSKRTMPSMKAMVKDRTFGIPSMRVMWFEENASHSEMVRRLRQWMGESGADKIWIVGESVPSEKAYELFESR